MKRAKAGGGGEPKIGVCGFPKAAIAEGESISAGRFSKRTNAEGKSTERKGGNPGSWKPVDNLPETKPEDDNIRENKEKSYSFCLI